MLAGCGSTRGCPASPAKFAYDAGHGSQPVRAMARQRFHLSSDVETPEAPEIKSALARLEGLLPLIGRTPLLEIRYRLEGRPRRLFAKYEALHLTGSVKDRMAAFVLRHAYEDGRLLPGDTHRRGVERQRGHLVRSPGPRAWPSGADLHARLDEPRARRPDPRPGGRGGSGLARGGRLLRSNREGRRLRPRQRARVPAPAVRERSQRRRPTSARPGPRSSRSLPRVGSVPMRSWPAWGPAGP